VALTGQLLAFARQQVITPEVAELDATVMRVLDLLRRVLGEDIEVVTLLDARQRVRIDVHQFEQVLVNFATNARDAMPGGGKLTITSADVVLAAHEVADHPQLEPGPYVMLAVADTGSGMAPDVLARVFEPFFTTKEQGQGTGLGLATCYGIIAQSRGHIIVDSAPGQGARFRVYLPPVSGELPAVVPAAAPVPVTGTETVLVVEDEPSVRAVTVKALELAGFHVVSAANGSEAITIARDHAARIDLLLTDVVMPQMGGPQLAALLRAMRPDLAVLFVSGYTNDPGVLHGDVELLQKPFSPEVLATRVRQAIDRRPR
jgi:CheY-like chemotaxis protein